MRKKKKPTRSRKTRQQQSVTVPRNRKRRELMRLAVALLIAVPAVGGAIAAFKHNYEVTHDLSVIGQGVPTVCRVRASELKKSGIFISCIFLKREYIFWCLVKHACAARRGEPLQDAASHARF